jgi:predicted PilT family ATPase
VVVMPLDKVSSWSQDIWPLQKYAKKAIEQHIQELIEYRCHIEITGSQSLTMYVPDSIKGRVIWKQGKRIDEIQKITWFHISVRSPQEMNGWSGEPIPYKIHETEKNKKIKLEIELPETYTHQEVKILIWWQLMHFTANHQHTITIRRKKLIDHILQWDIQIIW